MILIFKIIVIIAISFVIILSQDITTSRVENPTVFQSFMDILAQIILVVAIISAYVVMTAHGLMMSIL